MNGLMKKFSFQIQKALNEAINEQDLRHVQASPRSVNEQQPEGDATFRESLERKSGDTFIRKVIKSYRYELLGNLNHEEDEDFHCMVTVINEAPNPVLQFLTGSIPSRTALKLSNCDHNDSLDTTLAAPEQNAPMDAQDTIDWSTKVNLKWKIRILYFTLDFDF